MSMVQEFKEFAMKGNVMDLAVGVIIGGAFGKIVDSIVGDLIMPFVAWIMGGKLDFSGMFLVLGKVPEGTATTLDALKKAQVPVFAYSNFITILELHYPGLHHFHHGQADQSAQERRAGCSRGASSNAGRCHAAARDSRQSEEVIRVVVK